MKEFTTLLTSLHDSILTITINRPEKLNALNSVVLTELNEIFSNLPVHISVVIITGSGLKSFVAGADISELHECDATTGNNFALNGQRVFELIERCPVPVIAAVNGFALGGGCELALSCHFRYASENAKFGQPEVNLGIIPGYGGTQRLTRLVGRGIATELILTGKLISANEAKEIGLVNKVVPQTELIDTVMEVAKVIASKSSVVVSYCLQAIESSQQENLEIGLHSEAKYFAECCGTEDFKEGTQAFLQKRTPEFKGR